MVLYDVNFNEICAKWALSHFVKNGLSLKPLEVKREIKNRAKELNVSDKEMAEAYKIALTFLFQKTMKVIDEVISGKVQE
jgi:hypothetical protein